jgi:hypothetical protein
MNQLRPEDWLWLINQLLVLVVAAGAVRRRIFQEHLWFCLYLIISSFVSATLFYYHGINRDLNIYAKIHRSWGYCAPVFFFLILSQLIQTALSRFPAIATAYRRLLQGVWLSLAIFGVVWYYYLSSVSRIPFPALNAALSYQQAAASAFALFTLFFLGFIAMMPVPMTPMRLYHAFLLGAFFIALSAFRLLSLRNDYSWAREIGSFVGMGGNSLALAIWVWKVRPGPSDSGLSTPRGPISESDAELLFARLESLNQTLVRSGPRFIR